MKKQIRTLKLTRETLLNLQLTETRGGYNPFGPMHEYGGSDTIPTGDLSCTTHGVCTHVCL